MKELEEKHWTDDAELMERFVLHRLNPDELNELEDHLRICEVCKRAVRAEQVLVAGIRRGGRERFKASLRKKIAARPDHQTPWGRILSAAAVIVILLTVGIYNRWFEAGKIEPSSNDIVLKAPANQREPSTQKQEDGIPDQEISQPEESQAQPQQQARKDAAEEFIRGGRSTSFGESIVSKRKEESPDAPLAAQTQDEMAASIAESDAIWIEGTILSDESDDDAEKAIRENRSSAPQLMMKKYDSSTNAYGAAGRDQQNATSGIANNISLSQQNSLSLPRAQQRLYNQQNAAKVLTRVERIGTTTQLTLYLDSLVDETTLSNATIEMPRADSLIVHLNGNQRIAFKVPPEWNTQLQGKPVK